MRSVSEENNPRILEKYSIPRESKEAERITELIEKVVDPETFPPEMHYATSEYLFQRVYHVNPGVTAVLKHIISCPAAVGVSDEFEIKLLGSVENREKARPILESHLGFKLK